MTSLRALCQILEKCTHQLEEEIKVSINDMHNYVVTNSSSEVRAYLEKAKDYHYKEIMNVLSDIISKIKIILFHEEKIRSLSDENNFTEQDLKRYSYVQRQVNAFSKAKSTSDLSSPSSEEGITVTKREKRRVASEISVESLEAWEKYLDQKSELEKVKEQGLLKVVENDKVPEVVVPVKRNNKSSARRRKKFISSTLNGFLEGADQLSGSRRLESIIEDGGSVGDVDEKASEKNDNHQKNHRDVRNKLSSGSSNTGNSTSSQISDSTDEQHGGQEQIYDNSNGDGIQSNDDCEKSVSNFEVDSSSSSSTTDDEVPMLAVMTVEKCNIIEASEVNISKWVAAPTKPRVIDVIYKKKPS